MTPTGNGVLIRRDEKEEVSKGGIILAEQAKRASDRAEVLAVGPGRITDKGVLIEPRVKAGDRILFKRFAGHNVRINGEDLELIEEDHILAVLE